MRRSTRRAERPRSLDSMICSTILGSRHYLTERTSSEAFPQEGEEAARVAHEAAARQELKKKRTPRLHWAGLVRRTFALDVLACVRCGGRRRVRTGAVLGGALESGRDRTGVMEPVGGGQE